MNIFITGASGFIGKRLVEYYTNCNHKIVVLVRDHEARNDWLYQEKDVTVVEGDLTDFNLLRRIIADHEISHVFHCAAQSIVRICAQDPITAYETNVMGTVKLLEAIRTVGMPHIKSVVVSTSDKAYGHAVPPYNEGTPLQPKFTYEATKSCQDIAAQNYFHNYGLPVKIARCSNVYGPGDPNGSRLVPNTIKRILNNQRPQIYEDVARFKREFVYVDDVVDAFDLIANKGVNGEAYCVGGTGVYEIDEVVKQLLVVTESSLEIEYLKKTASNFKEIESQYIDASKLRSLGWTPLVPLKDGLEETVKFYKCASPTSK